MPSIKLLYSDVRILQSMLNLYRVSPYINQVQENINFKYGLDYELKDIDFDINHMLGELDKIIKG